MLSITSIYHLKMLVLSGKSLARHLFCSITSAVTYCHCTRANGSLLSCPRVPTLRFQHREETYASEHRSWSRPSCVRVGKKIWGRLKATRSPVCLSKCLSQTWKHRDDPAPNTTKGYVAGEKSGIHSVCVFVKKCFKFSATARQYGALSVLASTVLDTGAGPSLIYKKKTDIA